MQASKIIVGKEYAVRVRNSDPVAFMVTEVSTVRKSRVSESFVTGTYTGVHTGTREQATVPVEAVVGELAEVKALADAKAAKDAAIAAKDAADRAYVWAAAQKLAKLIDARAVERRYGGDGYTLYQREAAVAVDSGEIRINQYAVTLLTEFLSVYGVELDKAS